ncbi:MAG: MBL fold metallo-hydrolase [Candidatus Thorarchaeota archaeon]|nr:MAG: MBL fold metallo-hydrolase [Candidatus Thorarchaeota archaeon]
MTEEISLAQSVDGLYDTDLGPKEFVFIYAGYASILLRTKTAVVVLDPADLFSKVKKHIKSLDLITYSHSHYDHYNLSNAVALYKKTEATIISEYSMVDDLRKKIPSEKVLSGPEVFQGLRDGPKFKLDGIKVELHRGVHPRQITQCRVTIGRLKIFHAADSGYWPVGKGEVDVAFLPTGWPSPTCAPGVALAMAMDMRPTFAVAVHGEDEQSQTFKHFVEHELPDTTVVIPQVNELVILSKP